MPPRPAHQPVHHAAVIVLHERVAVVRQRLESGEARPAVAAEAAVEHRHVEGGEQENGGERAETEAHAW